MRKAIIGRAARAKHMASPTCPSCSLNRVVDRGRVCMAKVQMEDPSHCQNQSHKYATMCKMASSVGWRPGRKGDPFPLSSLPLPLFKQIQALYGTVRPREWRNRTLYMVNKMQDNEYLWSPLTGIWIVSSAMFMSITLNWKPGISSYVLVIKWTPSSLPSFLSSLCKHSLSLNIFQAFGQ